MNVERAIRMTSLNIYIKEIAYKTSWKAELHFNKQNFNNIKVLKILGLIGLKFSLMFCYSYPHCIMQLICTLSTYFLILFV